MRILAMAIGVAAVALGPGAALHAEDLGRTVTARRVIDLTHQMHPAMAFWPGGVPFRMERLVDYDKGYRLHRFEMGENTGTHVDAPSHFVPGRRSIEQLPLAQLIVPAVMIDARTQATANADYRLSAADIERWEAQHGRVPEGALVILNTGWHKRFADPKAYTNMDLAGRMRFPGYGEDAARLLVARGVVGIGIDTLSLDPGSSTDFATHKVMLGADRYQIENLANLDALSPIGATVVVGVLPVRGGTQAQARVIALLP